MANKPPVKGERFFKLASMTAGVAKDYATARMRELVRGETEEDRVSLRKATGERIAATLGELKGAAMKVGQMASAAKELLPPEVAEALTKLQREAPPMDYEVIAQQIEAELGYSPDTLFRSFERTPFASASVGQVHRAVLDDGQSVVVKVQYPGVDGAVDSDLTQVKLALRMGGLISVPKDMLDAMFEELRARLHEELDYCNEADNVRRFHAFHRQHPWVTVPDVVAERSSKRVLTMEYVPGARAQEVEARFDQATRDRIGTNLANLLIQQIFELGWVHGDPNPANFAFREDGGIVLYDFGCVKQMQKPIVDAIQDLLISARDRDHAGLDRALIAMGPLRKDGAPLEPHFYDRWLEALAGPLYTDEPFDFGAATMGEDVMKLVPGVAKRMAKFQPAPELAIMDREIAGVYDIGRNIKARVPLKALLAPYMKR